MRKRPTNLEGLCDALNEIGIRATVIGRAGAEPKGQRKRISVAKARRESLDEIARIAANAKRFTSK